MNGHYFPSDQQVVDPAQLSWLLGKKISGVLLIGQSTRCQQMLGLATPAFSASFLLPLRPFSIGLSWVPSQIKSLNSDSCEVGLLLLAGIPLEEFSKKGLPWLPL